MKKLLATLALSAIALASCGGSSDGASDDPRVAQLVATMSDEAATDFPMSEDETRCAAERLVAGLPDDTVQMLIDSPEIDVAEAGFSADETDVLVDSMFECADMRQIMIDGMVADGAPAETAECVADKMDQDMFRTLMAAGITDDDAAAQEVIGTMFSVAAECGLN